MPQKTNSTGDSNSGKFKSLGVDFAVLLKCLRRLTLSWMKQHAQKFPACNLNGARAFHMKRNLFGDFGRPLSVSGCMKESVLRFPDRKPVKETQN